MIQVLMNSVTIQEVRTQLPVLAFVIDEEMMKIGWHIVESANV